MAAFTSPQVKNYMVGPFQISVDDNRFFPSRSVSHQMIPQIPDHVLFVVGLEYHAGVQAAVGRFVVSPPCRILILSAGQPVGKFAIQVRIVGEDFKNLLKLLFRMNIDLVIEDLLDDAFLSVVMVFQMSADRRVNAFNIPIPGWRQIAHPGWFRKVFSASGHPYQKNEQNGND